MEIAKYLFIPRIRKLITVQVFPKSYVSQSIFKIGGVILINNSANLK